MSTMDWVFSAVVVILAARCFVRGFVHEVLSVASVAVGFLAGLLLSNTVIVQVLAKVGANSLPYQAQYIIAFVLCFIAGFIIMKIIERMIREGLEASSLDIFDRVLGLALGIIEGFIIVGLFIVILQIQPFFDTKALLAGSLYAKLLGPIIEPALGGSITPLLKNGDLPGVIQNLKGK
ncbi:MAG: CvpA family protein [Spirochaetia bacterium]|nr:CvpA family protein [Spirochaetia bacterium]